jgi:thioredoxin 1
MSEVILTQANFEQEVIKSPQPVLVDFWAEWCGPCKMMGPVLEELAQELAGQNIKIAKCNVDDNGELAQKYNVMSIPSFKIFKDGQIAEEWTGALPKEALKQKLQQYL